MGQGGRKLPQMLESKLKALHPTLGRRGSEHAHAERMLSASGGGSGILNAKIALIISEWAC